MCPHVWPLTMSRGPGQPGPSGPRPGDMDTVVSETGHWGERDERRLKGEESKATAERRELAL